MAEIISRPTIILGKVLATSFDNHTLRCRRTTGLVAWTSTVHALYSASRKRCRQPWNQTLPVCRRKADLHHISNAISTLLACTNDIYAWLTNNVLTLNPSKYEEIVFKGPQCAENVAKNVNVAGSNITISSVIKSLGVILDK